MRSILLRWALLAAIFALCVGAYATPALDFGVPALGNTGVISYAGGATPLIGSGITVGDVLGIDTPLNAGLDLSCTSCLFAFTTGDFTGSSAASWFFGAGPADGVTLNGTVANGASTVASGLLLDGQITSATVTQGSAGIEVLIGVFLDKLNADLASFFGLPGGFGTGDALWSGTVNLSFSVPSSVTVGSAFTSTSVRSGDINTSPTPPVPEPTSLLLVGTGLVGFAGMLRRRLLG